LGQLGEIARQATGPEALVAVTLHPFVGPGDDRLRCQISSRCRICSIV